VANSFNPRRQHGVIASDMRRHHETIGKMASPDSRVRRAAALIEEAAKLLFAYADDAPARVGRSTSRESGHQLGRRP